VLTDASGRGLRIQAPDTRRLAARTSWDLSTTDELTVTWFEDLDGRLDGSLDCSDAYWPCDPSSGTDPSICNSPEHVTHVTEGTVLATTGRRSEGDLPTIALTLEDLRVSTTTGTHTLPQVEIPATAVGFLPG
jgi:hypothetical protein